MRKKHIIDAIRLHLGPHFHGCWEGNTHQFAGVIHAAVCYYFDLCTRESAPTTMANGTCPSIIFFLPLSCTQ